MSIVRMSFLVDTDQLGWSSDPQGGFEVEFLNVARAKARAEFNAVKADEALHEDKRAVDMARLMRRMMATLMIQANLSVEEMPEGTVLETALPFERISPEPA